MPKTRISEYSTTNADNTDIEGINIAEGCAPSGINNAIREIMVHLKEWQSGAADTYNTPAGTVSAPAIAPTGDSNTGIFFPAADTIAFAEGGAEAMRIDSSGNVGIGATTVRGNLNIYKTAANFSSSQAADYGSLFVQGGNANTSGSFHGSISFGKGISGVSRESYKYGAIALVQTTADVDQNGLAFFVSPNADQTTPGTLSEAMRIDSSGNVLVGATTASTYTNKTQSIIVVGDTGSYVNTNIVAYDNTAGGGADVGTSIGFLGNDGTAVRTFGAIKGGKENATSGNYAGYLGFATRLNGGITTERMRITSAGEVLVGGTTAVAATTGSMTLQNGNASANLYLLRNDASIASTEVIGDIGFYGADTTGNTPTRHAYIYAVASGTHAAGDNPTDLAFGCTNDGSETVAEFARLAQTGASGRKFDLQQPTLTNGSVNYFIATAGTAGTANRNAQVGVYKHAGITNCCGYLAVVAEDAATNYIWADNSDVLRISTNIDHIGTTSGTVVGAQTSDERIKNILGPVEYGLAEVLSIEPVKYALKSDPDQTPKLGFIAQQVNPIVPESVFDTDEVIIEGEPTKLGMEYVSLIPVLVNAVKELSAKCDALQAEVNQLKGN